MNGEAGSSMPNLPMKTRTRFPEGSQNSQPGRERVTRISARSVHGTASVRDRESWLLDRTIGGQRKDVVLDGMGAPGARPGPHSQVVVGCRPGLIPER